MISASAFLLNFTYYSNLMLCCTCPVGLIPNSSTVVGGLL